MFRHNGQGVTDHVLRFFSGRYHLQTNFSKICKFLAISQKTQQDSDILVFLTVKLYLKPTPISTVSTFKKGPITVPDTKKPVWFSTCKIEFLWKSNK